MLRRSLNVSIIAAVAAGLLPVAAQAQWWRRHPAYIHAMSDLRGAYWLIGHRDAGDPLTRDEERFALRQILRAYQELKDAAIIDDTDITGRPPPNMNFYDHRGRLHRALDLLHEARADVLSETEDPAAAGLRGRALDSIAAAAEATRLAIVAWNF